MAMKSNINRRKVKTVPLAIPETMLLLSSDIVPHTSPWERTNRLLSLPFCTSALSQRRSLILLSISFKLKILIRFYTSVSHRIVVFLQFLPGKVTILLFWGKLAHKGTYLVPDHFAEQVGPV